MPLTHLDVPRHTVEALYNTFISTDWITEIQMQIGHHCVNGVALFFIFFQCVPGMYFFSTVNV